MTYLEYLAEVSRLSVEERQIRKGKAGLSVQAAEARLQEIRNERFRLAISQPAPKARGGRVDVSSL